MNSHRKSSFRITQAGFSLVSVMVAAGILGILTITILQLAKMISTQSRRATDIEDVLNVTKQVEAILSNSQYCLEVYKGLPLNMTNMGSSATSQLNVSSRSPFAGAPPMSDIASGRIKLLDLGIAIRRDLTSAGAPWYLGEATVHADDPSDPGNFAPRRIALNFTVNAANEVSACATVNQSYTELRTVISNSSTGLAYGMCGPGQVMVGIASDGIKCQGGSGTASGVGCTGDSCTATDGGTCYGNNCVTNGSSCTGNNR